MSERSLAPRSGQRPTASGTPEPLAIQIKRWPDREARFGLSRPTRNPPTNFGLSLSELREIAAIAAEVEIILAEEPNRPGYEMGDLKLMIANRRSSRSGPGQPQDAAA
jgi:hypothetical protein